MGAGQIDLLGLELPIVLRPSAPVSDEELMRFSRQNKPFKVERNKEGDLTIMTPVGGIGGTHEQYITGTLFVWTEQDGRGIDFSPRHRIQSPRRLLPPARCFMDDPGTLEHSR